MIIFFNNGDLVPAYNRYWRYAKIVRNIANPLWFRFFDLFFDKAGYDVAGLDILDIS